jgi:hypothetical protein
MTTSNSSLLILIVANFAAANSLAAPPVTPPTFAAPTTFTNPYFPFTVGDVKIYRGKEGKKRIAASEAYLADTREFTYKDGTVVTRIVREIEFKNGRVLEISHNHFAQADDGTVWFFGELVDKYHDGAVVNHEGSWLVGGSTLPGDPAETVAVAAPVVIMPGTPDTGDTFDPEGLPGIEETVTIEKFVATLTVEAGTFHDVMRLREEASDEDGFEKKWHAPGVGLVRAKDEGEVLELIATTQTPAAPLKSEAVTNRSAGVSTSDPQRRR